uniref:Uncharacterized protein n=1 Tax=Tetraodon nigroviridis TaxID=99883 RepID=H3BX05_TETNG
AKMEAEFLQEKYKQESKHLQDELRFLGEESKDFSTKLLIAEANKKDRESQLSKTLEQLNKTNLHLENLQWGKDQAVAQSHELKTSLDQCKRQLDQNRTFNKNKKTNKHLKEELDQVRSNNKLKDDLNFQREQTENDLQRLKQRLQLVEQLLLSQSETSEKNKKIFEDAMLRHEQALQEKERELAMLDECR